MESVRINGGSVLSGLNLKKCEPEGFLSPGQSKLSVLSESPWGLTDMAFQLTFKIHCGLLLSVQGVKMIMKKVKNRKLVKNDMWL